MNTHKWFVIINPTSGNGKSKKKWPLIFNELKQQQIDFDYFFTNHKHHAQELITEAIIQKYHKFICVGGDGTIHDVVNGILNLKLSDFITAKIKIGVIPIGTGNDWIKTYKIPKNYKKAIAIIKKEKSILQDIGKLHFTNKIVYFNNLAGIGFDGYVVYKINAIKKLGFIAYLAGALIGIISFKKPLLTIKFNQQKITGSCFMLVMGICKFSGGGMQLTKFSSAANGLFDISYIKKLSVIQLLVNIKSIFNGKIAQNPLISNFKTAKLEIQIVAKNKAYIQADGELIESENFNVSIIPKALNFIIP